jgi:hypothetical protein
VEVTGSTPAVSHTAPAYGPPPSSERLAAGALIVTLVECELLGVVTVTGFVTTQRSIPVKSEEEQ